MGAGDRYHTLQVWLGSSLSWFESELRKGQSEAYQWALRRNAFYNWPHEQKNGKWAWWLKSLQSGRDWYLYLGRFQFWWRTLATAFAALTIQSLSLTPRHRHKWTYLDRRTTADVDENDRVGSSPLCRIYVGRRLGFLIEALVYVQIWEAVSLFSCITLLWHRGYIDHLKCFYPAIALPIRAPYFTPPPASGLSGRPSTIMGKIIFSPARLVLVLIKLRWSRGLWSQTRTRATCYASQQNSHQCDEYLHCTAPNMMSVRSRGPSSDSDVDRSCIQSSTEPGMRIAIVRSPISKLTSSSVEWYPGWLKKSI